MHRVPRRLPLPGDVVKLPGVLKRNDWILWGALGCALVSTAHAEYTLATAAGAQWLVAGAVPGALDLYVIRALQMRRDVFLAVLVMVAANVASYLVHSGDLEVTPYLRSAVGALAPLILWRVHSLRYTRTRQELLWGLEAGAVSAPAPAAPEEEEVQVHPEENAPETDANWLPDFLVEQVHPSPVPGAPALPPLPAHSPNGYDRLSEDDWNALRDADRPFLDKAEAYLQECAVADLKASVRGLKKYAGVGQDRAERLLAHLTKEKSS